MPKVTSARAKILHVMVEAWVIGKGQAAKTNLTVKRLSIETGLDPKVIYAQLRPMIADGEVVQGSHHYQQVYRLSRKQAKFMRL